MLWIARHAPVAASGLCYGRFDVPTRLGSAECAERLIGAYPGDSPPELVWSSSTARCQTVATELASRWDREVRIDPRLCELDFGKWEGRAWAEIEETERVAYEYWMRNWRVSAPPGGETPREIEARARSWLESLQRSMTHALVAHAGFVRVLRVIFTQVSWADALSEPVPHLQWQCLPWPRAVGTEEQ